MAKAFVYVDGDDATGQSALVAGGVSVIQAYATRALVSGSAPALEALAAHFRVEPADELDRLVLPSVIIDTTAAPPPPPPPEWRDPAGPGDPTLWLVQFVGPSLQEWVEAVAGAGATILGILSPQALVVRMTQAQSTTVAALQDVQWVGHYEPLYKIHPELAREPGPVPAADAGTRIGDASTPPAEKVLVLVRLSEASEQATVTTAITGAGGTVRQTEPDTVIAEVPRSTLPALAVMPAVTSIDPWALPGLALNLARPITLVEHAVQHHGLDGEGEGIGIADTGLDVGRDDATLNADFKQFDGVTNGRVTGIGLGGRPNLLGGPNLWNDPGGHGTHVTGIAAGNGITSGLPGRRQSGVAFKAHIVMQSLQDPGGNLGGIPGNLNQLFGPVYDSNGVRVHNNSWALAASLGQYLTDAREVDEFVWRNPDMVVVFAAGNAGTDVAVPLGVSDFGTISPQVTFRNGIAVGASETNRPGLQGRSAPASPPSVLTWLGWGFASPPLSADQISSDPNQLAPNSGRGPTSVPLPNVGRIKPDIVGPGWSILSVLSSVAPMTEVFGIQQTPPGLRYQFMGGTSMAAPHVAGCAALIRQYLRLVHGIADPENAIRRRRRPSAALVKALIVHGAKPVTGAYTGSAITNGPPVPGSHQGWGRIDLRRTLFSNPIAREAALDGAAPAWLPRRTIFLDRADIRLNGVGAGARHEIRVRVADASVPLRATLVWTDFPGPAGHPGTVLNSLELSIHRRNPAPAAATPFRQPAAMLVNNVQQVDVAGANLLPLEYDIRVDALAVPSFAAHNEQQDFALVVSGAISHSDHLSPGVMKALPDLAFVDLVPNGTIDVHDGLSPSPPRPPGNPGSPDIWISKDVNADPAHAVERVLVGDPHHVYVRVRNLGFAPANGTQVNVYWADPGSPLAFPGDWKTDGFSVGGVSGNRRTVDVPARGEVVVGPFDWTAPSGFEEVALFVRAVHPDDPITHEGEVRLDNNITRRDVFLQDQTTTVQGSPSGWDKFVFFFISGFGQPRNIEARLFLSFLDVRDGKTKPFPPGVEVELYDFDPVSGDDKLATGRTANAATDDGKPASAVHVTFSTSESGERQPDIYVKVLRPSGQQFADFLAGSFFVAGADSWSSKSQATSDGGFFLEDFTGDKIGIPTPPQLEMKPAGIRVQATFEHFAFNGFEPMPAGIPVKILDSKPGAERPLLGTAMTDESGRISTVIPKRKDYKPSIYFVLEKTKENADLFFLVDFFRTNNVYDTRTKQGELVAADGTVSQTPGHFQDFDKDELVAPPAKLRFRVESPDVVANLRFQYFDRETGGFVPVPAGTDVEIWEDRPAAIAPLVTGQVGQNGLAELSVPTGGRVGLNLYARVVMRRTLSHEPGAISPPEVRVVKGGADVEWQTKGRTATDGSSGLFTNVQHRIPAAGGPPTFRIGTGAGDANEEFAAPFALKVVGDVHDWLRTRTDNDFSGILSTKVELFAGGAAEGSSFSGADRIRLNSGSTAPAFAPFPAQPDHWNRLTIAHQYAHLVFEQAVLRISGAAATVPQHGGFVPTGTVVLRVALAEGWADYVTKRHLAPPRRPDPSSVGPNNIQVGWRSTDGDGANNSGEAVPMAVANALWRLDDQVVGAGAPAITNPTNKHRFQALIWKPLKSLAGDPARQVPMQLYRAIQAASIAAGDLIAPHQLGFIRQSVRDIFQANGMVFTRGQITAAPTVPSANHLLFKLAPADRTRLNVAAMGRITAYRIQGRRVGATTFAELEDVIEVTHANQQEQLNVDTSEARDTGVLTLAGTYDWRVQARDEFGAWDNFDDDFTGNLGATATTNEQWQRNRLNSLRGPTAAVP